MTPHIIMPGPDALPLPAPAFLLQFLLQLTFLLHLLAMNAMLGGLLITLFARLKGSPAESPWTQLADSIAKVTPVVVAAAVTLGVAPLLFLQVLYGQFLFTSSILMGWGWFSVIVVLILAYYGAYLQSFRGRSLGRSQTPLLGLTVLLFLWVGFMFSNNTSLMLGLKHWAAMYFQDARGLHLNLGDPQLAPRYLHMVLGALCVAGLMLAWWGRSRLMRGDFSGAFMLKVGERVLTWGTLINLGLGLWYWLAQPSHVRRLFMGGDGVATVMMSVGLILAVALVVAGFKAIKQGSSANLRPASALLLLQLVTMITIRDVVRGGYLGGFYRPASFVVETQVLNFLLFGVLLLGGVAVLIWMLRQLYLAWER